MTQNHPAFLEETHGSESAEGESDRPPELPGRTKQTVPGHPEIRRQPHVLIVSSDEQLADSLISTLDESGFAVEHAATMTDACALAKSGDFYVVLTEPTLTDGSWRRLANLAGRNHLEFVVVLVAKDSDLRQRIYAKQEGAFDVIDAVHGLPKTGEVVMQALWVEYLNGVGPVPDLLRLRGERKGSH